MTTSTRYRSWKEVKTKPLLHKQRVSAGDRRRVRRHQPILALDVILSLSLSQSIYLSLFLSFFLALSPQSNLGQKTAGQTRTYRRSFPKNFRIASAARAVDGCCIVD